MHNTNTRRSGVELLKIIAMGLICISHCVQTMRIFVDYLLPTTDVFKLVLRFLRFDGNLGNIIFIVASAYFLTYSKRIRHEKAIKMLLDSQAISCVIMLISAIAFSFLKVNTEWSFGYVLQNIFPDVFKIVWFVPCFVIYYLCVPYLNSVIEKMSQKEHFAVCAVLFVFFGAFRFVNIKIISNELFDFLCIYVVISYLRRYESSFMSDRKKNVCGFLFFFTLLVTVFLAKSFLAVRFKFFVKYPDIAGMFSVILFPMQICLFNVFNSLSFSNRTVNAVSSLSLYFYCIHENFIVRRVMRPKVYGLLISQFGNETWKLLLYTLLTALVLFTVSLASAKIYSVTLGRFTERLSLYVKNLISRFTSAFLRREEKRKKLKNDK